MSVFTDIIQGIVGPISKLIDSLHTSDAEKLAAKQKLAEIQADLAVKVLDYERTLTTEQGSTIRAEAMGHSWLQRNWRPITMLLFAYIIAHNYVIAPIFGAPYAEMPEDLWALMKIGLGGYVIGRSAEKVVPATVAALKQGEAT